ncbi:MAG TPA: glycosyltransferase [Paludibacter sp.]|nr:glycosyltransferase [Paludibacter sp.]
MFSVIIPLYNKQTSVQQTIECVLNQTYTEFEIIVVDDGSTDDSVKRINEIVDNRIRLIHKPNGGVSSARNRGIENAKNRYIAFLDADDIWEPDYLLEQKRLIEDFPEAKMWGCAYGYISEAGKEEIDHALPIGYRGVIPDYFGMKKKTNIFWASSVVVDKKVFDEIPAFDVRMKIGEDLDVWYRIVLNFQVVFYNRILSYYRTDAENKAMHSKPDLQSTLFFYMEKFREYRRSNKTFRVFFDKLCLRQLYPYYLQVETRQAVKKIIKEIDFSEQPIRWRLQYMIPIVFRKIFN